MERIHEIPEYSERLKKTSLFLGAVEENGRLGSVCFQHSGGCSYLSPGYGELSKEKHNGLVDMVKRIDFTLFLIPAMPRY